MGCTYQGAAISSDDVDTTTQDLDIRIYEKSVVTCSGSLAGAAVAATHPSQDADGLVYDSTNYMKIPASMGTDITNATGVCNLYLLNRSAYWPSGLAVASRLWKNWSQGAAAASGDNQKFNLLVAKAGYDIISTAMWSGADPTFTLNATAAALPGLDGNNVLWTYDDGTYATHKANYTWGEDVFAQGWVEWNADIDDVFCNATLYTSPAGVEVAWWNASYDFTANTITTTDTIFGIGLSYDTTDNENGSFYFVITFENATIESTAIAAQYSVHAAYDPGLEDSAFVGTYDAGGDFRANYTWGEHICPDGEVQWTYAIDLLFNVTVRDSSGVTVLWLFNGTESYAAGVGIQITVTTGLLDIDTSDLVSGTSYAVVVQLWNASIVTTYIYGGFAVLEAPDANVQYDPNAGYYDALCTQPGASFVEGTTVYLNPIATLDTTMNADVLIEVYYVDPTLGDTLVDTLLSTVGSAFTAAVATELRSFGLGLYFEFDTTGGEPGLYYIFVEITATALVYYYDISFFNVTHRWPSIVDLYISATSITEDVNWAVGGNVTASDGVVVVIYAAGLPVAAAAGIPNATGHFQANFTDHLIPVGAYAAGSVVVYAQNATTSGFLVYEASLAVTVTPGAPVATPTTTPDTGGGGHYTITPPQSNETDPWRNLVQSLYVGVRSYGMDISIILVVASICILIFVAYSKRKRAPIGPKRLLRLRPGAMLPKRAPGRGRL